MVKAPEAFWGLQWRPWRGIWGCNGEGTTASLGVQWGGHQAQFGGAVGHGWLVQRDWGCDGDGAESSLGVRGEESGGVQCLLAAGTGALPPQHCQAPRKPLPPALPRSDLRQILATKSVENIQFLPFLTTDAKYSGVGPWGGGSHTFEGQGGSPGCSQVPVPCPCSNLSWLGYGCLKGDGTLITVNAIGAALQTLYILVYLYYSPAKVGQGPGAMGRMGDPHPDVPLLSLPAPRAAAGPAAPGCGGHWLRLLHHPG